MYDYYIIYKRDERIFLVYSLNWKIIFFFIVDNERK